MKILVLTPDRNSTLPPKADFTKEFLPASRRLEKTFGARCVAERVSVAVVDSSLRVDMPSKQKQFERSAGEVLRAIERHRPDHVVLLCHGWSTGVQLGFRCASKRGADEKNFAALCETFRRTNVRTVGLFACFAGDQPGSDPSTPGTGENSFADLLRDRAQVSVVAHYTRGVATTNPDLIFFGADGSTDHLARGTAAHKRAKSALKIIGAWTRLVGVESSAQFREALS